MENKRLAVRFTMRTPFINPPMIDGLLAAVKYHETGDVSQAHELPFERAQNGMYLCSGPLLENFKAIAPTPMIGALRPSDIEDVAYVVPNKKDGSVWWEPSRKRNCGNVSNQYETAIASHINYIATVTDEAEFKRLVKKVTNIGKLFGKGFGQVGEAVIQKASSNGVVDGNGQALRPVPLDFAKEVGVRAGGIVADATYKLNYWDPANRTACYVAAPRNWTIDDIEDELL